MSHPLSQRNRSKAPYWLCLILLSGLACQSLPAQTLEDHEDTVQQVIRAQMAAFADDQAEEAFSYASRGIRDQFGTAEHFMAVVAQEYPAVYRAGFVSFGEAVPHDGFMVQTVTLRGPEDRYWEGHYRMVREEGHWRINGVQLRPVSRGI